MNKLTTLTLVAVAMISSTGCCRGLTRWFGRGDTCGATSGMYEGADFSAGPTLMAPTVIPQRPIELPGPVTGSST
jgi:hypothetical protein